MGFRNDYRSDLWIRGIDLGLHMGVACVVPFGWLQFVPDLFTPWLFIQSWVLNKRADNTWVVWRLYQLMHTVGLGLGVSMVTFFLGYRLVGVYLLVHWAIHLIIDWATHEAWSEE